MKKTIIAFTFFTFYLLPFTYPTVAFAQDETQKADKAQGSQIQEGADFLSNPQSLQAILPDSLQQKTGLDSFLEKVKDIPILGGIFSGIFTKIFPRTQLWQAVTVPGKEFTSFENEQKADSASLWQTTFSDQGFANFVRPSEINFGGSTDLERFKMGTNFLKDSLLPAELKP